MTTTTLLISQSPELANSLARHFSAQTLGADKFDSIRLPPHRELEPDAKVTWILESFEQVADSVESSAGAQERPENLRSTCVIVDLCEARPQSLAELNPTATNQDGWSVVVAMLVLAYPEVHWVFNTPHPALDGFLFSDLHILCASDPLRGIERAQELGYSSLFDPTGLRNSIRQRLRTGAAPYVPVRGVSAAAIDEEEAFAYLHAYTAYRFGFRAWPVFRWGLMWRMFGGSAELEMAGRRFTVTTTVDYHGAATYGVARDPENGSSREDLTWQDLQALPRTATPADAEERQVLRELANQVRAPEVSLLLEDLYLSFPDEYNPRTRSGDLTLSNLSERDELLPYLRSHHVRKRIFITVGHTTQRRRAEDNHRYLRRLRRRRLIDVREVSKPLAGMYRLWQRVGMWGSATSPQRCAPGFDWPPREGFARNSGGHSAPGRLLLIAQRLLRRAEAILARAQTAPDAVHAAVLALEAKELLSYKTPTTALEAVSIQHQAEVVAESLFHGVEYTLDVTSRLRDVKREVAAIGEWFDPRNRHRSVLNARIAIVERLARRFREHGRFEEERLCLREARALNFNFWMQQRTGRRLFKPMLAYIDFSLRSLAHFGALVLFWLLFFGSVYTLLKPAGKSIAESFSAATVFFFSLQSPVVDSTGIWMMHQGHPIVWNLLLAFQAFISVSHLGILISHLYMILSRR